MKPEPMIDLSHTDEIEIRHFTASSKAEAEDIKTELERRGFTVSVRDEGGAELSPGLYHAEIFAEKRSVPKGAEVAAHRASQEREENARRRDYRLLGIGLGIILVLGLLVLAFLFGPLLWTILH